MSEEADGPRLMRLATYASLAVGLVLLAVKLAGFIATNSVALLSTMVDSGLDVAASVVNLVAVRQALTPADREHRFGHGKAEPLAGLAQAAFVIGSALFLIVQGVQRVFSPAPVTDAPFGYGAMALSIVLGLALVVFEGRVLRRARSVAIGADLLHYTGDIALSVAAILALFLSGRVGWSLADPIFAIVIAGVLIAGAVRIALVSFDALMDREFEEHDRARIMAICHAHPDVKGVHDLRTRTSGQQSFIQLHLELDPAMRLSRAHVISEAVEQAIQQIFPAAEVIIHEDPAGIEETRDEFR